MSEVAVSPASRRAGTRALSIELRLTWELVAYAAFIAVGAGMRFWDLGSRALHHDESLHGFYAYEDIFRGLTYQHDPLLHGPFQFFGTALTFFLAGGASDYTVRIFPALFGAALIALPLLFRDRLGSLGALAASGLIALSPTLLYFSRFARNDIYVAVFTLGIVISLWRYLDERKPLWLYAAAGLLGLSFATKENTFINAALLLVFLNLWLAADLARQTARSLGRPRTAVAYGLLYLPWAWAIVALWPLLGGLRARLGLRTLHPAGDFLIVLGTLTLPQLSAAVRVPIESLGYELDTLSKEQAVGVPTVLTLLAGSALVGLRWNWRVWPLVVAAFYVPYALLHTSFGTNLDGFGTGMWDSLDYWLAQHQENRLDQPDFYYLMFLPAYEFLALAFAGPALLYYTLRGGPRSWLLTLLAVVSLLAFFGADSFSATAGDVARPLSLPVAAVALFFAVRGSPFERFLVFWTASAIVAYSWVGEKAPWLSVHTTLPVVVLAGYSLGRVFAAMPRPVGLFRSAPSLLPFAAGALGLAAVAFAAFGPAGGTLRLVLVGSALLLLLVVAPPLGRRRLAAVAAAAVLGGLALFSVRTGINASFEYGDVPRELLVYTQTSPDVPDVMERIDATALSSGRGHDLPVIVDTTYTWPWAWYLRDYRVTYETLDHDEEFTPPEDAVLLISRENEAKVEPLLDRYQEPVPYRLRWWFPESYRGIGRDKANLLVGMRDFAESVFRGGTWENWWRFFRDREPPGEMGSVDSTAYFPLMYDPSFGPDVEGRLTIGRFGDTAGTFDSPSAAGVDGDGNLYVLDGGNGRIEKFAPDGRFLKAAGVPGSEEGEFNQPGDLALDSQGNVYVVDTWNHRVQKFDADLDFLAAWGRPTKSLLDPGPDEMWGPRAIAVDAGDNVWVVDTGTNRVRKFSPQGEPLGVVGERGSGLGQFREPVGIAIDSATGDALVADAGNARVQRIAADLRPLAAYLIEQWGDLASTNKPDLAALPDGRFLASDPAHGRILLLDGGGVVVAAVSAVRGEPLAYPRGIAYDEAGGFVFAVEGTAHRVRRFPLSDFALP